MAQQNMFQGELDPEIAALLGTEVKPKPPDRSALDYAQAFGEGAEETEAAEGVDLSSAGFPEITKRLESTPHNAFNDPGYYKTALSGEGDIARRVHSILQKYLNAKDPKDRGVFRQQFILVYWEFLVNVARKAPGKLTDPKKYLLRFGMLHPTFLDPENRNFFAKIIINNYLNQPVYYLDEWFKAVGTGLVRTSTTDEVKVAKSNNAVRLQQFLEKAQGKLDGARNLLRAKDDERVNQEKILTDRIQLIMEHFPLDGLPDINACYSESQKRVFGEIQECLKALLKIDHDLEVFLKDYSQAEQDARLLRDKIEEEGSSIIVDAKALDTEFDTVRQMAKMTIGRQGNHFPILTGEYFHSLPSDVAYRENVIAIMNWIESIDPEAFCRSYKNRLNRIIPYVVLIPAYGDYGMCWEPFDRFNRATSRGRIAVPMYPKNLQIAVLAAVGDLRWQVAREKASYYWMEEGLTGNYYQWFQKMKLKGDLKDTFIADYITWLTRESEGTQKLDKELRGVFWRHIPFAKPIKEKLKTRSHIYQELYQRDVNRSLSDGY
ncbi:MAG: hypothetical protein LBS48_02235 [Treponema sp.]|jgi:hypothetical protein|nr:hypothetical protein [Treponema sp.]